jgi:5-methylcytosine-specific restriction endonuclease McrA
VSEPRKRFSTKERASLFNERGGVCSICKGHIDPKCEAYEIEHTIPLGLTGTNDKDNLTVVHSKCHKAKTLADVSLIAKAKRQEAKGNGADRPSSSLARGPKEPKRDAEKRLAAVGPTAMERRFGAR